MADVELIAPTQKGNESKPLTEFVFNDKGYVESCPAGHVPDQVKYKKKTDRYSAAFDPTLCQGCPHAEHCPVKPGKKKNFLRYGGKQYRLWVRRRAEKSEAFIDTYRWRAGVEATMSAYDRLTGGQEAAGSGHAGRALLRQDEGHRAQPAAGGTRPQDGNEGREGRSGLRSRYYGCFLSCQRALPGGCGKLCCQLVESAGKIF